MINEREQINRALANAPQPAYPMHAERQARSILTELAKGSGVLIPHLPVDAPFLELPGREPGILFN